jgi:hypothetical protein
VIAALQSLGGTATITLQTSHSYYTPPGATPGEKPDENAEPGEKLPLLAPGNIAPRGTQPPAPPAKKGA